MQKFLRSVMVCAVCVMGLASLSPLAAQSPVEQQAMEGSANIYNLDRDARVGGIEIQGRIGKAVANEAAKLIRSIRPDVDELTVFLNSPGGDVAAAMELGEEIRKQWALTTVDDDGECFGACVLVLAAGVTLSDSRPSRRLLSVECDQAAIGDGNAVGIAGEIGQHRLGSAERGL
jgi:hypothetical protein